MLYWFYIHRDVLYLNLQQSSCLGLSSEITGAHHQTLSWCKLFCLSVRRSLKFSSYALWVYHQKHDLVIRNAYTWLTNLCILSIVKISLPVYFWIVSKGALQMEFTYNHTMVHNNLTLKPPILPPLLYSIWILSNGCNFIYLIMFTLESSKNHGEHKHCLHL